MDEFILPNLNAQMTLEDKIKKMENLEKIEYVRASTVFHNPEGKLRNSLPCFRYVLRNRF